MFLRQVIFQHSWSWLPAIAALVQNRTIIKAQIVLYTQSSLAFSARVLVLIQVVHMCAAVYHSIESKGQDKEMVTVTGLGIVFGFSHLFLCILNALIGLQRVPVTNKYQMWLNSLRIHSFHHLFAIFVFFDINKWNCVDWFSQSYPCDWYVPSSHIISKSVNLRIAVKWRPLPLIVFVNLGFLTVL